LNPRTRRAATVDGVHPRFRRWVIPALLSALLLVVACAAVLR
jgi:hypothetical protein